jgi:hypothetical protein
MKLIRKEKRNTNKNWNYERDGQHKDGIPSNFKWQHRCTKIF